MSSSVYAVITSPISAADVAEAIKQGYGADEVQEKNTSDDEKKSLTFKQSDGKLRYMNVFLNGICKGDYSDVYQGDATFITLGTSGDSIAIMKAVLERHGGYLIRNDEEDSEPEFIHPVKAMSPEELMNSRTDRAASLGCEAVLKSLALDGVHIDRTTLEEAVWAVLENAVLLENKPSPETSFKP